MFGQLPDIYSQEAVDFNLDSNFLPDLEKEVEAVRLSSSTSPRHTKHNVAENITSSNLLSVIKKYTNLTTTMEPLTPVEAGKYNAMVIPAIFDKNHPLLDEMRSNFYDSKDLRQIFNKNNKLLDGSINLTQGKVYGAFSETVVPLMITIPMLIGDKFSTREVAAIILHEVGHILTFMEYLGRNYLTVHTLEFVSRNYNDTVSESQRTKIIKAVSDEYDIKISDAEQVGREITKGEVINTMIVKAVRERSHYITGTPMYEDRTSEAIADQYVSRIGGARELATAVDKLQRYYGIDPYKGVVSNLAMMTAAITLYATSIAGLAGLTAGLAISAIMLLLTAGIYLASNQRHEYDPPHQRLARIRKEMVEASKLTDLDRDQRRKIMDDINIIEQLEKSTEDKEAFGRILWNNLTTTRRNERRLMEELKELENLLVNPLYVTHNKLQAR